MNTPFQDCEVLKAHHSPKKEWSINLSQEPTKIQPRDNKGPTQGTKVHDMQTNFHILDYPRQENQKHNIYNNMQGTKPKHAKGQVTFNVNKLCTSYRKEAHWI